MTHVFEPAASGRAKCRGCAERIERGMLRFGERVPNAYAEGEGELTTLWYHPLCAAYKRPEALLEALPGAPPELADRERLEQAARTTAAHHRLPRIDGAERAASGQAKCRQCREPIAKGTWRIRLVFYEDGRFGPGGFLHLDCGDTYFEGHPTADALLHFSRDLAEADREELRRTCV
jgi:hypothetical protein